ncbi:MAG: glycosyltransferase, partial [bacterium]|nr:glycosyltransferase [bacterium]
KQLSDYHSLCPEDFQSLQALLPALSGKRVLHINTTAQGGGVAEILQSSIPLENSLGIESSWCVLEHSLSFFTATKKIHNGLQGATVILTPDDQETYLGVGSVLKKEFEEVLRNLRPDIVVFHDPQPLPLIFLARRFAATILRLHVDLSTPQNETLEFLKPFIGQATEVIVSTDSYRTSLQKYSAKHIAIIPPAIDPLTKKNEILDTAIAKKILTDHAIDPNTPFITQISRFDTWKDPLGAIEAYHLAKSFVPGLQLILAGFVEAADDPEATEWIDKVTKVGNADPNIFIFSELSQLRHLPDDAHFINALNTLTSCALQMSLREGFGLTITEAMWKERVVVARPSRGAQLQITHGKNGYLASTPAAIADYVVRTLTDPETAQAMGKAARSSVTQNFLLPRYLRLNYQVYRDVLTNQ